MYYLIDNVFQCLILPSSWLLCQIGGSTCTTLQIELLKLKLSKHEGPGCTPLKPDLGLFEICLNYGMLTRVGSTCTASNISMINYSIFPVIMPDRW